MCLLERRIIHPTYSITAQTAYSEIVRNAVVLNAIQQDSVTLKLFPGTPAEAPSLPSIPQDAVHVRLLMYAVRLNPGAESLTERDWYDYREDANVCGYCKCILGKCKVTEMLAQLAQIEAEMQEYNDTVSELTNKVDTLQTEVDDIIGGIVEIGTCGENIHYVLYENGKLLLHGTGETYDY